MLPPDSICRTPPASVPPAPLPILGQTRTLPLDGPPLHEPERVAVTSSTAPDKMLTAPKFSAVMLKVQVCAAAGQAAAASHSSKARRGARRAVTAAQP